MAAILITGDKPLICELLTEYFHKFDDMTVQSVNNGTDAARLIADNSYDLAIIDVDVSGTSGVDLAALAANGNTSVLLITGNPESRLLLHQFDYPHLAKPFTLDALRVAATRIISEHAENLARVKASAARMTANHEALRAAMVESDRLLDASRNLLQLRRWEVAVARIKVETIAD